VTLARYRSEPNPGLRPAGSCGLTGAFMDILEELSLREANASN
jgi:hypothetical protein